MRILYGAVLLAACALSARPALAVELYSEDFDGQENWGLIGNGSGVSPGTAWSLDPGGGGFPSSGSSNDLAAVRGGQFLFQDLNFGCSTTGCTQAQLPPGAGPNGIGYTIWQSPLIDPTGFDNLMLEADWFANNFDGSRDWADGEDLLIGFLDDAGSFNVLFDYILDEGTANGANSGTLSQSIGTAAAFSVFVASSVDDGSDVNFAFDNVFVTGDAAGSGGTGGTGGSGGSGGGGDGSTISAVPLPASALFLIGAVAGIGICARKRPRDDA
ncbi:MAG: VPLPA-CTERM sorting domain-containing protein [Pseudomonadota bacterium]